MNLILKKEYDDNRKVYLIKDVKISDEIHNVEVGVEFPKKELIYVMVENDIPLYREDFSDIDEKVLELIQEAIKEL